MRTWLTLWLCACMLLASPVRGAGCVAAAVDGAGAMATVDDQALPPCHRGTPHAGESGTEGDTPGPGHGGCDHCQCPCRTVAVPLTPAVPDAPSTPPLAPLAAPGGVAQRSAVPPLPPPIA